MPKRTIDKAVLAQLQSEQGYQGFRIIYQDFDPEFRRFYRPQFYSVDGRWNFFHAAESLFASRRSRCGIRCYTTVNRAALFILGVMDSSVPIDTLDRAAIKRSKS